jgi:raffinose/stachyose/melibiose transport system substrate-binding protein
MLQDETRPDVVSRTTLRAGRLALTGSVCARPRPQGRVQNAVNSAREEIVNKRSRCRIGAALLAALAFTASTGWASAQSVTLTWTIFNNPNEVSTAAKLVEAFEAQNPGITIETEMIPAGEEGDNLVKTRLSTGDMSDLLWYNAGSLFHALNPQRNFVDLTDEPFQDDILDSFKAVVSAEGRVYGVPIGTALGGGVLYNRKIYEQLGLSVPRSWAEFMANNEKVKTAGIAPVIQTFGDAWTAQLFVLGDYYNVQAVEPDFAERYTNNAVKYATDPVALKGFQRQEEVFKAGYLNEDFASAKFEDGLRMVAEGEGAHYPMLSITIGTIAQTYPERVNDVGFFALPGDDPAKHGLTTWMPNALYVYQGTEHAEEAKRFVAFVASVAGCDAQTAAIGATGPYLVKGCTLPADVPTVVTNLLPYFETEGATAPALEFLSPIKGPNLPQITVEVGSGFRSAADGAALYDEDVKKQAQQLGLPAWQ